MKKNKCEKWDTWERNIFFKKIGLLHIAYMKTFFFQMIMGLCIGSHMKIEAFLYTDQEKVLLSLPFYFLKYHLDNSG